MHTFPVLERSSGQIFPPTDNCAECGAHYDRDGEYVALHALTFLAEDSSMTRAAGSELNMVSLGIWHVRNYSNREGSKLYLVRNVHGGFAAVFFCSTACLRAFLNSAVDALERGDGVSIKD